MTFMTYQPNSSDIASFLRSSPNAFTLTTQNLTDKITAAEVERLADKPVVLKFQLSQYLANQCRLTVNLLDRTLATSIYQADKFLGEHKWLESKLAKTPDYQFITHFAGMTDFVKRATADNPMFLGKERLSVNERFKEIHRPRGAVRHASGKSNSSSSTQDRWASLAFDPNGYLASTDSSST